MLKASIDLGIEYLASPRGETLKRIGKDHRNDPLFIRLYQQASWMMDMLCRAENQSLRSIAGNAQSQGKNGDPRDLVLTKVQKGRPVEVGISCKNNSNEVKSLRLGVGNVNQLFFKHDKKGQTPSQYQTTGAFRRTMLEVHSTLDDCRKYQKFRNIPPAIAEEKIFGPAVHAFCQLILDLEALHGTVFTRDLFQSVFGTKDYYLLKGGKRAIIEGFNLRGRLAVQKVSLPKKALYLATVDENSKGHDRYARLFFGNGWAISYRLKNGDSDITPNALKFTIELVGKPSAIFRLEKL